MTSSYSFDRESAFRFILSKLDPDLRLTKRTEQALQRLVRAGYERVEASSNPQQNDEEFDASRWPPLLESLAVQFNDGFRVLDSVLRGATKIEGVDPTNRQEFELAAFRWAGICPLWPFC